MYENASVQGHTNIGHDQNDCTYNIRIHLFGRAASNDTRHETFSWLRKIHWFTSDSTRFSPLTTESVLSASINKCAKIDGIKENTYGNSC